jgi:hypothetical protein
MKKISERQAGYIPLSRRIPFHKGLSNETFPTCPEEVIL